MISHCMSRSLLHFAAISRSNTLPIAGGTVVDAFVTRQAIVAAFMERVLYA